MASGAQDVRAIAEALGHDRLAIWGISGGGPYALACAALLPDMAVAVATVASLAPYGIEGFDYFAGMGELNAEDIKLFFSDRDAARRQSREELLTAGVAFGRAGLGSALAVAFLLQVTPSVWTVYRSRDTAGVSRGTWLLIFGELLCWGVFGIHEADPRLIVLGATGVVASLLVLARVSWPRADPAPVTHLVQAP